MNARAEETLKQRRRRSNSYNGFDLRLEVPEDLKDPNYAYRWINDEKGRLQNRTRNDDWDFVEDGQIVSHTDGKNVNESDNRIRREVGISASGRPLYAYLCKKRKEYVEEDARAERKMNEERYQSVIRKQDASGTQDDTKDYWGDEKENSYIPREVRSAIGITEAKIQKANQRRGASKED